MKKETTPTNKKKIVGKPGKRKEERELQLQKRLKTEFVHLPNGRFSLDDLYRKVGVQNRIKFTTKSERKTEKTDYGILLKDGTEIWHMDKQLVNLSEAPYITKLMR